MTSGLIDAVDSLLSNQQVLVGAVGVISLVGGFVFRAIIADIVVSAIWWTVDKVARRFRQPLKAYVDLEDSDALWHRIGIWLARRIISAIDWYIEEAIKRLDELLDEQGFERLSKDQVKHKECHSTRCWRRPFTFTEIHEDYALDRQRVDKNDERVNLTNELVAELHAGDSFVIVGPPGSGKTVVLKSIAVRWYEEDFGPVFYRKSGSQGKDVDATELGEAIELSKATAGTTLVVVEDVMRPPTGELFDVIKNFRDDEDVCFLLDSRERELERKEEVLGRLVENPGSSQADELTYTLKHDLKEREIPPLDETEVERFIEKFKEVTDETFEKSAKDVIYDIWLEQIDLLPVDEEVIEQIVQDEDVEPNLVDETESGLTSRRQAVHEQIISQLDVSLPGSVLLLMYHLPVGGAGTTVGDGPTLLGNVQEVLRRVEAADDESKELDGDLFHATALLANVLNATRIGVHKELLYALGWWDTDATESETDFERVERCIAALDGLVLFGQAEGTRYWSHHALWSKLYLETFYERYEDKLGDTARQWFERATSALFAIPDEPRRREAIQQQHGASISPFERIAERPTAYADYFVRTVFELGTDRPPVAPLFATSEYSGIELPETASKKTKVMGSFWRARMFRLCGEYEAAWTEVKAFGEGIDRHCPNDDSLTALFHNTRGKLYWVQSNPDAAREQYETALDLNRKVDDRRGEAQTLNNLGIIAQEQSDNKRAREYFEESLTITHELGDRYVAAQTLNNLGTVAQEQSDYERAREYFKDGLEIKEALGDRHGAARSLNNLGTVAYEQSDYERAREYFEESLTITRELGDRRMVAITLNNLGIIARHQSDYERAREYYEESLTISRELGDRHVAAQTLNNLGAIAQEQSDYERAREYYEESLTITRELGNRYAVARSLNNLGTVAYEQSDYERAREYYEESHTIARELGDRHGEAQTLNNLGIIAQEQSDNKRAREYFEESLTITRELGHRRGAAQTLNNLGAIAKEQSDYESAREYFEESLTITRELGHRRGAAQTLNNLGIIAQEQSDYESAREYFEEALAIFTDIGAVNLILTTSDNLVGICFQQDETDQAIAYCDQAIELINLFGHLELTEKREQFERHRERLLAFEENLDNLYEKALGHVLANRGRTALELFRVLWNRRDEVADNDEGFTSVLAGGVCYAALLALFEDDGDQDVSTERDDNILSSVEPHKDHLSTPMTALYESLATGEPDTDPEELIEGFENVTDIAESDRAEQESVVATRMLGELHTRAVLEELSVEHCYSLALFAIGKNDPGRALRLLRETWTRRDDIADDHDLYPLVLAAGTLLAALTMEFDMEMERTEVLDAIEPHTDRLSDPVTAVFQFLNDGETDVTPEDLTQDIDEDAEEYDQDELAAIACAGVLRTLQEVTGPDATKKDDPADSTAQQLSEGPPTEAPNQLATELQTTYREGLTSVLAGDDTTAVDALFDVWYRHDDVPTDDEAYTTVLAAGVAVALLVDESDLLDATWNEIVRAAQDHYSRLSLPVAAGFATLDGTDPPDGSVDLQAEHGLDGDEDLADLDIDKIEALAFARLLERV